MSVTTDRLSDAPYDMPRHSDATRVADGRIYLLGGSVRIDGRISWYGDADLGRYLPFNSYLLVEEDQVLLVESGVPAVFANMTSQLKKIPEAGAGIARLAVTRNEPDCVANIPRLVRECGLKTVHSPGLMNTLQYFPADGFDLNEKSFSHRTTELQMFDFGVGCTPAAPGGTIEVSHGRSLEILAVPLKVLPTAWFYDRTTRTMFCSDTFSDETAVADDVKLMTIVDDHDRMVERFHESFTRKFDWLARSDLSSVISDMKRIFDQYEIDMLAPNRGLAVRGSDAVKAKTNALLTALKTLQM